jgi:cytochrome c oxidase subunit 2
MFFTKFLIPFISNIFLIIVFLSTSLSDYAYPFQLCFQDPCTPLMEGIIIMHHDLVFLLIVIGLAVGWILFRTTYLFYNTKNINSSKITHGTLIETVWTIIPSLILMLIAIPSFALLYSIDEVIDPLITLKVIGQQWFWNYEYSDFFQKFKKTIQFDSYIISRSDLEIGGLRLLEVDNRIVVPTKIHIRVIITSNDVLHSWSIPSIGIKMDACPGRLNQVSIFINRSSIYYGQCSELCGINHGFMPIVIESVSIEKYIKWLLLQFDSGFFFKKIN